jgi:hypothetical protein
LERGREDPATGGVRSTALARAKPASERMPRSLIAEELPPELAPTLF